MAVTDVPSKLHFVPHLGGKMVLLMSQIESGLRSTGDSLVLGWVSARLNLVES